jgi:hypothetical protein
VDELVGELAAKTGPDRSVADETIGIMPAFPRGAGPCNKIQVLIGKLVAATIAATDNGGLARLMGVR